MPVKQTVLPTTKTAVIECPANTQYAVLGFYFCNPTNADDKINIWITNATDPTTVTDANKIFHDIPVLNNSTKILNSNEKIFLGPKDKIVCQSLVGGLVTLTMTFSTAVR